MRHGWADPHLRAAPFRTPQVRGFHLRKIPFPGPRGPNRAQIRAHEKQGEQTPQRNLRCGVITFSHAPAEADAELFGPAVSTSSTATTPGPLAVHFAPLMQTSR